MSEHDAAVGNAADASQVKAARKSDRRQEILQGLAWTAVLATVDGQRVIESLLEYIQPDMTPYSPEALAMAHRVGRQDVGRFILAKINQYRPETSIEMMQRRKAEMDEGTRPRGRKRAQGTDTGHALTDEEEDDAST